ncbi:cytosolic branched-chain amino acid aminotransferase [Xylogone sp. PMI_703]|nr:cytosolic branched-chain amino acid aminotransferase [Xylogone sp. PMI_703]
MSVNDSSSTQKGGSGCPLDASRLHIQRNQNLRTVSWSGIHSSVSQSIGTDHMLIARWKINRGWADPEIVPYDNFTIPPTASCLHYATQCFEGMKVYRGHDGLLRLFRPNRNCERLRRSALQVSLPTFDPCQLERLIMSLVAVDGPRWLPGETCRGKSLYIRPAMIADGPEIGVRLPQAALLFVIMLAWPELPRTNLTEGLKLITSHKDSIRAWPGGTGSAKIGANYGPNFVNLGQAQSLGFDQVLWLFGDKGLVTEAGASNFFVVWRTTEGAVQLITAPLDDNIILPGVTRDSVLDMARKRLTKESSLDLSYEPLEAMEQHFTIDDIHRAVKEGRLMESFVSGTAYFITPVTGIRWCEEDICIPMTSTTYNSYAELFRRWLSEIMYGVVQDPWAVEVIEKQLE